VATARRPLSLKPLSSTFATGWLVARAWIGRKMGNVSAFPQVTGLELDRPKIVREFEFTL